MAWVQTTGTVLYYIGFYLAFPFVTILIWAWRFLEIALAPAVHLGHFLLSTLVLPLRWIAKFETLYIYLGVAALIGVITGSILHFSSSLLISMLNLAPVPEPEGKGRTAATVRAAREQKMLDDAWQSSSAKQDHQGRTSDESLEIQYNQWLEKDVGKRKKDGGLFRQTILEEDDDSMDGF